MGRNTRKTRKMMAVEENLGDSLENALPKMLTENGLVHTAHELGVSNAALGYWVLKLGIRIERVALRPGETIKIDDQDRKEGLGMTKEHRDYAAEIAALLGFDPNDTVRVVIDLDARRDGADGHTPITICQILTDEKFDALKAALEESHKGPGSDIPAQILVERSPGDRALDALRFDIANENEILRLGVEAIRAHVLTLPVAPYAEGHTPNIVTMCDRILAMEEIDVDDSE